MQALLRVALKRAVASTPYCRFRQTYDRSIVPQNTEFFQQPNSYLNRPHGKPDSEIVKLVDSAWLTRHPGIRFDTTCDRRHRLLSQHRHNRHSMLTENRSLKAKVQNHKTLKIRTSASLRCVALTVRPTASTAGPIGAGAFACSPPSRFPSEGSSALGAVARASGARLGGFLQRRKRQTSVRRPSETSAVGRCTL